MDSLVFKTFLIVLMMLCTTALAARRNHAFETKFEFWGLFIGMLALLFIIPAVSMPWSFGLAFVFAWMMGALVGPGIKGTMMQYVVKQQLKAQGYTKEKLKAMSASERDALASAIVVDINNPAHQSLVQDWDNILSLALFSTGGITLLTAVVVAFVGIDFGFLGLGLFIALLALIVISLLNIFWFKSPLMRLLISYVGAVIFSLYLLYDFDRLEDSVAAGDTSWETAINLGISIYLDIVNLFLYLLDILSN
jgi:FtsH-binding integral membrane protein